MSTETTLWRGGTSQLVHFWTYLLWLIVAGGIVVAATMMLNPLLYAGLAVPALGMLIRWLLTRSTRYELTTQRLRKTSGILTRQLDELELYRVKDSTLEQPLWLRPFGLGNVTVLSSDATLPLVQIRAVNDAYDMREKLRVAVESERDRKRVREMEVSGGADTPVA
jgi:membrane protein YdbS with pleckstrin-like domain